MDLAAVLNDALRLAVGPEAALLALAAIGLNLQVGYSGLLNLGQAGFMLVGAYGLAVTVTVFGGPLWLGALVGVALAVVLALVVGIPTVGLRPEYLAVATLAAAEILWRVAHSGTARPLTGGVFGLEGFTGGLERPWLTAGGWTLVLVASLLVWGLMRSPWGRVARSAGEDGDAARSLGKNVHGHRLQSLVLGGVFGALGGMLLALTEQAVHASAFTLVVTLLAYAALVLGGAGRIIGPVVGAVVVTFVLGGVGAGLEQLVAGAGPTAPTIAAWTVEWTVASVLLVALLAFRPQGILGRRGQLRLIA